MRWLRCAPMVPSALLLALLAGCATTMTLPADFLRLQNAPDYRAVTADDARVWVRAFADPDEGTLDFWVKTLQSDLVDQRGYVLAASGETHDGAAHPGRWLECRTTAAGERLGYLVAVFVVPKPSLFPLVLPHLFGSQHIWVVEFAAREAVFQARVEAVRSALATLQP